MVPDVDARHQKQPVDAVQRFQPAIDRRDGAIRASGGNPVLGRERPAIKLLPRDEVGDSQRFQRARESEMREILGK